MIAKFEMPDFGETDPAKYNEQVEEIGGYGAGKKAFNFEITQKIVHAGEVNKARYMPQNPDIIATMSSNTHSYIYDRTKHPNLPKDKDKLIPEITLRGHTDEGFGLNWNPHLEGQLATGGQDQTLCLYDIKGYKPALRHDFQPVRVWKHHSGTVNDIQHHPKHRNYIGTVSDDLTLQIVDTREKSDTKAAWKVQAHQDAVNCIAFHPNWETVVATGSEDKTIALWDMRCLDKKLHSIEAHKNNVISLEWHPQDPPVIGSASYDRRINVFDLSRVGEEQTPEEAEDGPPELLFMHGGFTNRICDFSWNLNDPWVIAAAAEDNQMQVFRPSKSIVQTISKTDATMGEVEE
jgi:histone-binding protein RBBP4